MELFAESNALYLKDPVGFSRKYPDLIEMIKSVNKKRGLSV